MSSSDNGAIVRELRAAPKIPGQPRIYYGGEKNLNQKRLFERKAFSQSEPCQDIKVLQSELGLSQYQFPF
jgi:hypothetical protein